MTLSARTYHLIGENKQVHMKFIIQSGSRASGKKCSLWYEFEGLARISIFQMLDTPQVYV